MASNTCSILLLLFVCLEALVNGVIGTGVNSATFAQHQLYFGDNNYGQTLQ